MAYDPKSLSVLAYANGFTLWHYRTDDTIGSLFHRGHFDAAHEMLRAGDLIIVGHNYHPPQGKVSTHLVCVDSVIDGSVYLARPC